MKFDGKAFGEEFAEFTKSFVERQLAPLRAEVDALKIELAEVRAVQPTAGADGKDGRDGIDGNPGAPGERGSPGERGTDGAPGIDGKDGVGVADALIDREGALVLTLTNGATKALGVVAWRQPENDLSDREFERRVEAALAESNADVVRDAVAGAMRENPRPTINVSVPITMPRRGKEIMTVEHDAKGRIKRSVKEEVD